MKNTFNTLEAIQAQKKYCEEKDYPHFAPTSGRCYRCNKIIYEQIGWKIESGMKFQVPLHSKELHHTTGITVEEAGSTLVTGCPHCNRSYCD